MSDDKGKEVWDYYYKYLNDSRSWRVQRDKKWNVFLGNQWPADVKQVIKDENGAIVTLNSIRPRIRQRVSAMTAKNPSGTIYGAKRKDMDTALSLRYLLDYILYISKFNLVLKDVMMGEETIGVGYFVVHHDPAADYGRGEIKISYASYRNIFVDQNTANMDYSDAPRVIHTRPYTLEGFVNLFPDEFQSNEDVARYTISNDEVYWNGETSTEDEDKQKKLGVQATLGDGGMVRLLDCYEKRVVWQRILRYITGTVITIDDDYEFNEDEKEMLSDGTIVEDKAKVVRVVFSQVYGNAMNTKVLKKDIIMPIDEYPVIPVINECTGNAFHIGEIDFTEEQQAFKNKCASLMIENASQHSNPRTYGDSSVVQGGNAQAQVESQYRSGSIVWLPKSPNGDWPIKTEPPSPINQAFAYLVNFFSGSIDATMSTYEFQAGNPANVPNTATMGLSLTESAREQLTIPLKHLEAAIERTFNIVLQLIPYVYTSRKIFPIICENQISDEEWVINDTLYNEELRSHQKHNDVTLLQARYRVKAGSTLPPTTLQKLALLKDLAASDRVFLKYVVDFIPELSDQEKDDMKKELDIVPQLQSAVQQLQQALQESASKVSAHEQKSKNALQKLERVRLQLQLMKEQYRKVKQSKQSDTSDEEK